MEILNNLLQRFNSYTTYVGRARVREVLLRSSDRMLEDAGFSRELLESGVKAWPWHATPSSLPPLNINQMDDATAMRELQNCSDKDLHDLGINKNAIPEAVKFGRDGIDNKNELKVA